MPRLTRPATFATTRRANRPPAISARTQNQILGAATRTLTGLGISATRSIAGPAAAEFVSDIVAEVRKYRRGGSSAILQSLAIQSLGGIGKAIAWLLGGGASRGRSAPSTTAAEMAAARQIVEVARAEAPIPVLPRRGDRFEPTPDPSTGRGRGGGRGDTGRGRVGGGLGEPGDTGRGGPPSGTGRGGPPSGGESGEPGFPMPNDDGGIQMFRVVNSTNVHSYGYDVNTATLYVRYLGQNLDRSKITLKRRAGKGGSPLEHVRVGKGASLGRSATPGPMYAYFGVPERVFAAMRVAVSKGKFVWDALRVRGSIWRHQYTYRLVAAGHSFIGRNAQGRGEFINYVPRQASRKGFRRRILGMPDGREIQSNMSRTIGRKTLERQRLRRIGS